MAAKPIFVQAVDTNGNPYSGAKLYVYDAGTTTPRAIYTESGLGTASANPAIADANGVAVVWVDDAGGNIKVTLTNSAGSVTAHNEDNVPISALTCYPVLTFQGDQSLLTTSSPTFANMTVGAVPFSGMVSDPGADRIAFWDDSATQMAFLSLGTGIAISGTELQLDGDLQDISGLTPTDGGIIIGDGTDFVVETGATARASLGLAIGSQVQAYSAALDVFAANGLTADELGQLQNIGASTISAAQWGYLGATDQSTATSDDVTFASVTSTGNASVNGVSISPSGAVLGQALGFPNSTGTAEPYTPAGGGDTLAAANETISGNWNYTGSPTLSGSPFVSRAASETLTNKTISLAGNTLTGTTAQFNTALSDGTFATLAGAETLTNKSITSAGSATARTLESRFTQSVNVKDFGAVVDGATDDYTAINNALNSGADEVVLEGGSARVATTVTVPPGVTFRCHGDAKIVLTTDIDGVRLHGASKFYGTVDASAVTTYTSAALLYDGSSEETAANAFRLGSDNDAQVHLIGNEASDGTNGGAAVKLVANGSDASISGATQADPVVITASGHSFTNGQTVFITGVVGMTEINDRYFTVANASGSTFELSGEDGTGHTAYTSGGTAALKAWVMNVRCKAKVEGFDKACWIDQNSSTSACFITSNDLDIEASGSRQGLVMDTDATYDVDGNRIQIRNQTRDTQTTHTVVANKISGQLNDIYLLQWDWVGGNGGSVNALELDSAARSSRIVTFLAGSYINNASSERSLFIENLLSGEDGHQLNDIKPTLADLRLHSADLRLDNAKALKVRNAGDTADVSVITLDASGNTVITSDAGSGDGIVFNAANSAGTFTIQQNGATVIQSDANRHLFYPGFAGAANGITFRNFSTAGRTQDFANVSGTFAMEESDGQISATSGFEVGGVDVIDANRILLTRSFTVATVPAGVAGGVIYVSDETGGATIAFYNGANWVRVSDLATVA